MATDDFSGTLRKKGTQGSQSTRDPDPIPSSSLPDPLADTPEPPGIEVNDVFFKAIERVATKLENVRTELNQIQAMSRCLQDVLLYSDDDDGVQHADVAHVIARLLNDVATDLELIKNELPTNAELARSIMGDTDKDVAV